MKEVRIVQASGELTGSTLLANLVLGFVSPKEKLQRVPRISSSLVTKMHDIKVDEIMRENSKYDLFFIMSERCDNKVKSLIPDKYRDYNNVLIVGYDDINETDELPLEDIISDMFVRFKKFLPKELIPQKSDVEIEKDMTKRIRDMNARYQEIKDKPFSFSDDFYGIHGHHRNGLPAGRTHTGLRCRNWQLCNAGARCFCEGGTEHDPS